MKKAIVRAAGASSLVLASFGANAYTITAAELNPISADITANLAVLVPWALGVFIAIFGARMVFKLVRSFLGQAA